MRANTLTRAMVGLSFGLAIYASASADLRTYSELTAEQSAWLIELQWSDSGHAFVPDWRGETLRRINIWNKADQVIFDQVSSFKIGRNGDAIIFATWPEGRSWKYLAAGSTTPVEFVEWPSTAAINDSGYVVWRDNVAVYGYQFTSEGEFTVEDAELRLNGAQGQKIEDVSEAGDILLSRGYTGVLGYQYLELLGRDGTLTTIHATEYGEAGISKAGFFGNTVLYQINRAVLNWCRGLRSYDRQRDVWRFTNGQSSRVSPVTEDSYFSYVSLPNHPEQAIIGERGCVQEDGSRLKKEYLLPVDGPMVELSKPRLTGLNNLGDLIGWEEDESGAREWWVLYNDGFEERLDVQVPSGHKLEYVSHMDNWGNVYAQYLDEISGAYNWVIGLQPTSAVEMLEALQQKVLEMNLKNGISSTLDAKIDAANRALSNIRAGDDLAAVKVLEALLNEVDAQAGNFIPIPEAESIKQMVSRIIWFINGGE